MTSEARSRHWRSRSTSGSPSGTPSKSSPSAAPSAPDSSSGGSGGSGGAGSLDLPPNSLERRMGAERGPGLGTVSDGSLGFRRTTGRDALQRRRVLLALALRRPYDLDGHCPHELDLARVGVRSERQRANTTHDVLGKASLEKCD